MKCQECGTVVTENDCTFGGLHRINDCSGRVFKSDGSEYIGRLEYNRTIKSFMTRREVECESDEGCSFC